MKLSKTPLLFVVDTNYQLLNACIICEILNEKFSSYLISMLRNNEEIELANKLSNLYTKSWIVDRINKGKKIERLIKFRKLNKKISKIIKEIEPSVLVVYKDNGLLAYISIEEASRIGSKIYMFEEGLALYKKSSYKKTFKSFLKKMIGIPNPLSYSQGDNPKVNTLIVKYPNELSAEKKNNKKIVEWRVGYPEKIVKDLINRLNINIDYVHPKCILYIGQPLSELSMVTFENEQLFFHKVFNTIYESGFHLYIKPHPRDNISKYRKVIPGSAYTVLDRSFPAELIIHLIVPKILITVHSSAADNIASILNIPILYLFKLIDIDINSNYDFKKSGTIICSYLDLLSKLKAEYIGEANTVFQLENNYDYELFIKDLFGDVK